MKLLPAANFEIKQNVKDRKVKLEIDNHSNNPIYLHSSCGEYIEHSNDKFCNMYYMEEEKRGFFPEEDHDVPGRYEIDISGNTDKEVSFICSLEENIEEVRKQKNEVVRTQQFEEAAQYRDEEKKIMAELEVAKEE